MIKFINLHNGYDVWINPFQITMVCNVKDNCAQICLTDGACVNVTASIKDVVREIITATGRTIP